MRTEKRIYLLKSIEAFKGYSLLNIAHELINIYWQLLLFKQFKRKKKAWILRLRRTRKVLFTPLSNVSINSYNKTAGVVHQATLCPRYATVMVPFCERFEKLLFLEQPYIWNFLLLNRIIIPSKEAGALFNFPSLINCWFLFAV